MEDPTGAVVVGVGPTDDANQRQVLAVRSGDGVEHAEAADGERHHARADSPGARVAVGGVPGVELVAAPDQVQRRLRDEVVQQRQVEVPGNGEHVGDADFHQPAGQVAAQGGVTTAGAVDHRRRQAGLDGGAAGEVA